MKLRPDFGILTKQYKLPAWQQKVIEGTIICTLSKKTQRQSHAGMFLETSKCETDSQLPVIIKWPP